MVQLRDRTGRCIHLANRNTVALAASLGERFARIDGRRDFVQPNGPNDAHWDLLDETINACVEFGLEPYLCLNTTPAWASRNGKSNGPPIEIGKWTQFVDAAGRRYQGKVHYWGWVNEPNSKAYWDGTVAEYVDRIVVPGYETLKRIDSTNQIAIPDLATEGSWRSWLAECLTRAHGFFDYVAVHSYEARGRDVLKKVFEYFPWWNPFAKPVWKIMQQTGCVNLPLAITEYGLSTERVSEATQAKLYDEFLEALEKETRLACAVGFNLIDEGHGYGVFRSDKSPKPSAVTIQRWLKPPVV